MFNELSMYPLDVNKFMVTERMILFAGAANEAKKKNFTHIRSHYATNAIKLSNDNYTLHDWLFDKTIPIEHRKYQEYLYGKIVLPFINEDDEEEKNEYLKSSFYFEDVDNGIYKQNCLGLAVASIYNTLSISFATSNVWTKNVVSITVKNDDDTSRIVGIRNVFSKDCFLTDEIYNFINEFIDIELPETDLSPDKKTYLEGKHHGEQERKDFWNKLKHSRYVVAARSSEFGRGKPRFIQKIEPEQEPGSIIVSPKDEIYTLWIKTTGRNRRETEAIVKQLEEEYS